MKVIFLRCREEIMASMFQLTEDKWNLRVARRKKENKIQNWFI